MGLLFLESHPYCPPTLINIHVDRSLAHRRSLTKYTQIISPYICIVSHVRHLTLPHNHSPYLSVKVIYIKTLIQFVEIKPVIDRYEYHPIKSSNIEDEWSHSPVGYLVYIPV